MATGGRHSTIWWFLFVIITATYRLSVQLIAPLVSNHALAKILTIFGTLGTMGRRIYCLVAIPLSLKETYPIRSGFPTRRRYPLHGFQLVEVADEITTGCTEAIILILLCQIRCNQIFISITTYSRLPQHRGTLSRSIVQQESFHRIVPPSTHLLSKAHQSPIVQIG